MRLPTRANFEVIDESDIQQWCETKLPETEQIEFKSDYEMNSFRREWCKDVSSMANGKGGLIAIGVAEVDGCADHVSSINDVDTLVGKLQSTLDAHVRPRIAVDIRRASISGGGTVLLVRVQPSRFGPHMTTADDDRRIYKRTAHGAEKMDIDELRRSFGNSSSAVATALQASRRHQEALGTNPDDHILIVLDSHVVAEGEHFDPADETQRQTAQRHMIGLWDASNTRIVFDGYLAYSTDLGRLTQSRLLRTGTMLTHLQRNFKAPVGFSSPGQRIPHVWFPEQLDDAVGKILQIQEPICGHLGRVLCLSMVGTRNWTLTAPWLSDAKPIDLNVLEFPPIELTPAQRQNYRFELVEPWLHRLWQASGFPRCHLYSGAGGVPDWQKFCQN